MRFQDDREDVEDDSRPSMSRTDEGIEKIGNLLKTLITKVI